MSRSLVPDDDVPECPAWLLACAGMLPLAYYVASASAHSGWFQDAALVGTVTELGIGPPPGAPLSSLLSSLLTLVPVGPLAYRVACAGAAFMALGLSLFARALFHSLHGIGARNTQFNAALSLCAAWLVGQTPGFWSTATHANVYALEWLLSLVIVDALVRFELTQPSDDLRMLHFVAFVQGLCFANHYVLAMLTLPAVAPTLGRVFARRGFIGLMGHAAAPIVGFSACVYIPIRAGQHPTFNLGQANSLARLLSYLGSDPFFGPPSLSFSEGASSVLDSFVAGTGACFVPLALLALLGAVLARRAHGLRRFAVLWVLLTLVPLACAVLLIRPALASDRFGMLVPCTFGLAAVASLGVALLREQLARSRDVRFMLTTTRFGLIALVLTFVWVAPERSAARFSAPDALADLTRRSLPERALVLSYDPDTQLRQLAAEVEEHVRPDVIVVPLSESGEPASLGALAEQHPELVPILRDVVVRGGLGLGSLQSLSALRPLYLELDGHMPRELYPTLISEGLLSRVLPDGATQGDERMAAALLAPRLSALRARLVSAPPGPDGEARLASNLYFQALQAAALQDRDTALALLATAGAIVPLSQEALTLRSELLAQQQQTPKAPGQKR